MIECSLREFGEYGSALPDYNKRKRQGKYHGSDFYGTVPGYGIKKKPQPLYGNIDEQPIRFNFKEDEDGTFIEALLVTDQKKNKKFWGAGGVGTVKRKRGRPRKDEQ